MEITSMVKDAAISIRVEPSLKTRLEKAASASGVTLAAYVASILATHSQTPVWTLREPEVVHTNRTGTNIKLHVANGWPVALLSSKDAQRLGIELQEAAAAANKLLK
jgi:hypothetical protein